MISIPPWGDKRRGFYIARAPSHRLRAPAYTLKYYLITFLPFWMTIPFWDTLPSIP